jgi:hypothetical protein
MTPDDRLTTELREQARAFTPEPPAALRRRVFSALAEVDAPAATTSSSFPAWVRWCLAVTGLTAAAVVVVAVSLRGGPPRPTVADRHDATQPRPVLPTSVAIADPVSLAHRYLDQPFEAEVQHVLDGLTQTRDTVTRILPAPVRRARPATQPPPLGA